MGISCCLEVGCLGVVVAVCFDDVVACMLVVLFMILF